MQALRDLIALLNAVQEDVWGIVLIVLAAALGLCARHDSGLMQLALMIASGGAFVFKGSRQN